MGDISRKDKYVPEVLNGATLVFPSPPNRPFTPQSLHYPHKKRAAGKRQRLFSISGLSSLGSRPSLSIHVVHAGTACAFALFRGFGDQGTGG